MLLASLLPDAHAASLDQALREGTPNLDLKLRAEFVKQDNALKDAAAGTARLRLGYTTGRWHALHAMVEFEGTQPVGGEAYNSLNNGRTDRSVVADPNGDELNQAWLSWHGLPDTELRVGRSRLVLDNARFIGNVVWRQNEQTYDGYVIRNQSLDGLTVTAAQLNNANTPLFSNRPMDTQVLHLGYRLSETLSIGAYHYRIDFDQSSADHQTNGLRAVGRHAGERWTLRWSAEAAQQRDHGQAAAFKAPYYRLAAGLQRESWGAELRLEALGDDRGQAFATPLATLHAHNGWADQFLATPANGLRDLSLKLDGQAGGFGWAIIGHNFSADSGGADYGQELDLLLSRQLAAPLKATIKVADFHAESGSGLVDTRKLWLQLQYGF